MALCLCISACGGSEEPVKIPATVASQEEGQRVCDQLQENPPVGKTQISLDVPRTGADVTCVMP
jgi:hypothetical protein